MPDDIISTSEFESTYNEIYDEAAKAGRDCYCCCCCCCCCGMASG